MSKVSARLDCRLSRDETGLVSRSFSESWMTLLTLMALPLVAAL